MTDAIIQTHNLTKQFGNFTAVEGVTFSVHAGEVVGYLGPNGSGKTTTIRMLLGLLLPSQGQATVLGYDVVRQSESIRARSGYMSQKFALYHDLTAVENLRFYAGVYGVLSEERIQEVMELVRIVPLAHERVNGLSVGWRQRLALATAIVHRPRLLFLDEPTSGVDPSARRVFWDLIYDLVDTGVTALVTTHYMDEAEYCERIGIMRTGRLLAMDTPAALKKDALPGQAWDVFVKPPQLLPALARLHEAPFITRAGLAGDHLRAVTSEGVKAGKIKSHLKASGLTPLGLERVEASLEDVFLALAGRDD